jgi:hypothetical protein
VRIRVSGQGAPAGEVVLPTRYGGDVPIKVLALGDRDILLAETDGNGGTGMAQRLGVIVGVDDAGRLRLIGIESLQIQDSTTCESEARMVGALTALAGGRLRFACDYARKRGECGFRWRGRPHRERWSESLGYDGRDAIVSSLLPSGAGPVQTATYAARQRVTRELTRPVTDLRRVRLSSTGIFDLASVRLR